MCICCLMIWKKHIIEYQGKFFKKALAKSGEHVAYTQVTKDTCDGAVTSIRTNEVETKNSK